MKEASELTGAHSGNVEILSQRTTLLDLRPSILQYGKQRKKLPTPFRQGFPKQQRILSLSTSSFWRSAPMQWAAQRSVSTLTLWRIRSKI